MRICDMVKSGDVRAPSLVFNARSERARNGAPVAPSTDRHIAFLALCTERERMKRDWPRLMTRKMAAEYMGRCPKTFDKIRHRYAVEIDGLVRYDRVLMDRDIDLNRLVA